MALDLRPVQTLVAGIILPDTCTIWRDPEGSDDDVINPITLEYASSPDAVAVHTDLACGVKFTLRGGYQGEAGQPLVISEYEWKTGMPFEDVEDGDMIEMITSVHDQRLIGKKLKVLEVKHGSLAVLRRARVQLRERAVDVTA